MKIQRTYFFIIGLLGMAVFFLFITFDDNTPSDWGRYILLLAASVYCVYLGLSQKGAERYRSRSRRYNAAGAALYGKYYPVKANLPLIMLGAFFAVALILRFLFRIYTAPIVAVIFVLLLAVSVFYTIGLRHGISEYLAAHPEFEAEEP